MESLICPLGIVRKCAVLGRARQFIKQKNTDLLTVMNNMKGSRSVFLSFNGLRRRRKQTFSNYPEDSLDFLLGLKGCAKLAALVAFNDVVDTLHRIEKIADGSVVVKCIDEVSDVFTHIAADIPLAG